MNLKILTYAAAYVNCAFELRLLNMADINKEINLQLQIQGKKALEPTPTLAKTSVISVMNSFGCELALKSLVQPSKEHSYSKLFAELEAQDKAAHDEIKQSVMTSLKVTEQEFDSRIASCSYNFEVFRYSYEGINPKAQQYQDSNGYVWDDYPFVKSLTQAIFKHCGKLDLIDELKSESQEMIKYIRNRVSEELNK